MTAAIDDRIAAAFSSPIRQYSAAVQAPRAINGLRLITVSHHAAVSRAIVIGNAYGEFCCAFPYPSNEAQNIGGKCPSRQKPGA
jgi:hypothetical protein